MMTYRVGACASPAAGKAMTEYYLAGTLKTEPARAAASRHERTTWIVVDDASERRHLAGRSMIGQRAEIREVMRREAPALVS